MQAFKRQNKNDSFLKVERYGSKINLSFTGNKAEIATSKYIKAFAASLKISTLFASVRTSNFSG